MDAGRPLFRSHAPFQTEVIEGPQDLHSILYPSTLHFQLVDAQDQAVVEPIAATDAYTLSADEADSDGSEEDELHIDASLPCYPTHETSAVGVLVQGGGHTACRVLVDSKEMFCKALGKAGGLLGTSVGRELQCLQELLKSLPTESPSTIRVPPILGHVRHANMNRIVGFLRQWIPGRRLRNIDVLAQPASQRQQWLLQIRETVHTLHARGLTWGDGKASNVIIDQRDNAWLIDFGGGWTEGWVAEDLTSTIEGDEQATDKIGEFLRTGWK